MVHDSTLQALLRDPRWVSGDLVQAYQALLETACAALSVDRAAVWMLNDDGIRTIVQYDRRTQAHTSGAFLSFASAPPYFEALRTQRVLPIDDARADPRTAGFSDGYLVPEGIGALMDAPILVEGELVGVVCHEHVGALRRWTPAEQTFAATLGDLAALATQTARRREAEQALLRREAEVRVAMEAAGVADWAWHVPSDDVRWSPAVAGLFGREPGWEPDSLEHYLQLIHPDDLADVQDTVEAALASGDEYYITHRVVWPDGSHRWLEGRGRIERDADGQPFSLVGVVADVTERHDFEERLRRTERLEALGRLAGGVAHDFNNLLTAIVGASDILEHTDLSPHQVELVKLVTGSAERAAELTRQLLAFGRRQPNAAQALDLGALVREMEPLLTSMLGETLTLRLEADAGTLVRGEASQLQQVVLNLAVNGRDAMPDGGELRITVRSDPPFARLNVVDSGVGIELHVRERIFEPYFTTKAAGRGTGLGLALCHGVAEQLGGSIEVESTPGEGTVFQMTLPLADALPPSAHEPATGPSDAPPRLNVLLVEDEPAVALLLTRALSSAGHRVIHAATGTDAAEVLRDAEPDLLVCDVVLPGMPGPKVVQEARRLHGALPVIMMTGYAPDDLPDDLADIPLLTKPFRPAELLRRMAELIGPRPS